MSNTASGLNFPVIDPDVYRKVTTNYHAAVQLIGAVGRSFHPLSPTDHHASLQWVPGLKRLAGTWINGGKKSFRCSVSFTDFSMYIVSPKLETLAKLPLAQLNSSQVLLWMEKHLLEMGLPQGQLELKFPYELPDEVLMLAGKAAMGKNAPVFDDLTESDSMQLGNCYHFAAEVITKLQESITDIGTAHVWPHHFDLCARIILKDTGHHLTNTIISIGFNPGDEFYTAPYFYVNSWPYVAQDQFTSIGLGQKHTHEWTGYVLNMRDVKDNDPLAEVTRFYTEGIAAIKKSLLK